MNSVDHQLTELMLMCEGDFNNLTESNKEKVGNLIVSVREHVKRSYWLFAFKLLRVG